MKWISVPMLVLLTCAASGQTSPSTGSMGGQAATVAPPGRIDTPEPRDFGIGNQQSATITAVSMVPLVSDTTYDFTAGLYRFRKAGSLWFEGGVNIPTGGLMTRMELEACDTSATGTVDAYLYRCQGSSCSIVTSASTGAVATPGCSFFSGFISPGETVNQLQNNYVVEVADTGTDSTTKFAAVRVFWQRQLSPAPLVATFGDVPTSHPFFRVIEALAASGITTGCGGGNFCPDGAITRQEVAKFIARALGLSFNDNFIF
jgi:S-layer homology domain